MKTVDISNKPETLRIASAYGRIRLKPETVKAIKEGRIPKGDVLSACRLAGIMGAKKTSELLPFCHPVNLEHVEVSIELGEDFLGVFSHVKGIYRTGYEMESLMAVSTALLTVYDMCKAMDDSMVIEDIKLLEKSGGKSQWSRSLGGIRVKVLSEPGLRELIESRLSSLGAEVSEEDYRLLISTIPLELSEVWGVSSVVNRELFPLIPQGLKRGIRIGLFEGKPCVEIQGEESVISTFFETFGGLLGVWAEYGEAV